MAATNKKYKLNFTLADGSTKSVECDIPISGVTGITIGTNTLDGEVKFKDTDFYYRNALSQVELRYGNPTLTRYKTVSTVFPQGSSTTQTVQVELDKASDEDIQWSTVQGLVSSCSIFRKTGDTFSVKITVSNTNVARDVTIGIQYEQQPTELKSALQIINNAIGENKIAVLTGN